MNKEYIYINGNIIVSDEKGNKKPIQNYDNIEEILIQENLIETIEKEIESLEQKLNTKNKSSIAKKYPLLYSLRYLGACLITSIIGSYSFVFAINFLEPTATALPLSNFQNCLYASTIIMSIYGIFFSFIDYTNNKSEIKKEKGNISKLEFLKNSLEEEKTKLKELISKKEINNTTCKEEDFKVVEVDDKEVLKQLKATLNLYYNCGYNEKKYYKYHEQGILKEKLKKSYPEYDIEKVEEYLEKNQEKNLTRKRTRS